MSSSPPASEINAEIEPGRLPLLRAEAAGQPANWAAEHRETLRAAVAEHGSLLIRGLGLADINAIGGVFHQLGSLVAEKEAFASRESYADCVYSSSRWPPGQPMCMHHECSYMVDIPGLMLFACLTSPTAGGATGIADSAKVLQALPDDLVERFEREGWLLVRNFNDEIGASVEEAFGTNDPEAVEAYCRANAIEFEWQPGGGLRTHQRRSAVVHHPRTNQRCWFNQIAFLNAWTLDAEVREFLIEMYGEDGLPFNTRFGSGDPVGPEVVEILNEVYEANTVREPWQAGDLLLVDNIRTAHSREPFEGPRAVLVAMADPVRLNACPPAMEIGAR